MDRKRTDRRGTDTRRGRSSSSDRPGKNERRGRNDRAGSSRNDDRRYRSAVKAAPTAPIAPIVPAEMRDDLLVGRNPVIEALKAGREIEHIYIARGSEGSARQIRAMARDAGIPVDAYSREIINDMAPGEKHQGVIASVSAYSYAEMDDIFARAEESGEDPFIIVLDEISDPHNLGAVIRSAECAGVHGVMIPKRRACGLTSVVAKSSAGAVETMPCVRVTNMARALDELKEKGVWIAACDMDGKTYYEADLDGPVAIVIGSEGGGISRLVKDKCDFVVSIPVKGKINSLNASNAAAVIMYEVRRRRDSK